MTVFFNSDSGYRILRLVGDAKMGKTHMLRLYRHRAIHKWTARSALVDLRGLMQKYDDIINSIAQQIGVSEFKNYTREQRELLSRPRVEVTGLMALFSRVRVKSPLDGSEQNRKERILLTQAFLNDLKAIGEHTKIILMFDAFEQAEQQIQHWLNEQLLLATCEIPQVRVVIAGRHLPPPLVSLRDYSRTHVLPPVTTRDLRKYCHDIGASLDDDFIDKIHMMFKGKPGLFVDYVEPTFARKPSLR